MERSRDGTVARWNGRAMERSRDGTVARWNGERTREGKGDRTREGTVCGGALPWTEAHGYVRAPFHGGRSAGWNLRHQLPANRYQLTATSYQLTATSYQLTANQLTANR
jgi:hypothetical protein